MISPLNLYWSTNSTAFKVSQHSWLCTIVPDFKPSQPYKGYLGAFSQQYFGWLQYEHFKAILGHLPPPGSI